MHLGRRPYRLATKGLQAGASTRERFVTGICSSRERREKDSERDADGEWRGGGEGSFRAEAARKMMCGRGETSPQGVANLMTADWLCIEHVDGWMPVYSRVWPFCVYIACVYIYTRGRAHARPIDLHR